MLAAARFVDRPYPSKPADGPIPREAIRWLDIYFAGARPGFLPPMSLTGTDFQKAVWQELLKIPYGETTTYGQLAQHLGCRSAQAVGQAVRRNPIAIIIPCHRVMGADGGLVGYAYGVDRKRQLLAWERHP